MTIRRKGFYVLAIVPGISGFQRWNEREFQVVTGHKAANCRSYVVGEWLPTSEDRYRLNDGHLPSHQPETHAEGALEYLLANPFGEAVALGRTAERYAARYSPGCAAATTA